MRRTANADLAPFYKINARRAGLDLHVAAAAQYGFLLAVHDFHAHRSADSDGFAVDDPHGVGTRLVGAPSSCGDQRDAQNRPAGCRNRGAPPARDRIGEDRHSMILPATEAESLAYTIRRRLRSRL